MFIEIKPLLEWLHHHPHWAGIVVFLVTFTESLAIIGLFVPGLVLMVAIGSLIGTGYIPLVGTILWAIAGALCGDILSFMFGYHFHERALKMWPLRSYPTVVEKGKLFFKQHGGKSVFIGRFAGPVRPVLPLVAGMLSMSPVRFFIVDFLSAIIWAPLFLLPGVFLGAASQSLPKELATKLILFVVVVLLVIWCISWLIQLTYVWLMNLYNRATHSIWDSAQKNVFLNKWFYRVLQDPTQPSSTAQLNLFILFAVTGLAFLLLAINVYHRGMLTGFNQPIYHFMRSLRNNSADVFFVIFSLLSSKVLIPMWLAVFVWLLLGKYWRAAVHWLLIGILSMGATEFFKQLLHISRPTGLVKTPDGGSFPSGHTTVSFALFGFLAVLLTQHHELHIRRIYYFLAAVFAGAILLSRLYLTAHWLTDVFGGVLLASSCLALVTLSYRRKATPTISVPGVLIVAIISLLISWGVVFHYKFQKTMSDYKPAWEVMTLSSEDWWNKPAAAPLYRTDRFGKPIQVLNVQWAGSLDQIQQTLSSQGWNKLNKATLLGTINALTAKNSKHSYYIEQVFQDRKPSLEMEKIYNLPNQPPLRVILRLWDSHYVLDDGQILWVGAINYHKSWRSRFLKPSLPMTNDILPLPPLADLFLKDVADLQWKKIYYKNSNLADEKSNLNWDGNIILIK